jgi:hypothetical protein
VLLAQPRGARRQAVATEPETHAALV